VYPKLLKIIEKEHIQELKTTQNYVFMTIKNYHQTKGLSYHFFDSKRLILSNYEISGLHGKGLGISSSSSGTYVAFCGGTGILCFIDLATHLMLLNLQGKSNGLKFILYASFQNEKSGIALDYLRKL
jgi:hypothetical protein